MVSKAALFLSAFLWTTTRSKMADPTFLTEELLTSNYGVEYDLLQSKISGIAIKSEWRSVQITQTVFVTGNISDLYDEIIPSGPARPDSNAPGYFVNADDDTLNLDKCIVFKPDPADTGGFVRSTAYGCTYTVTLDANYEIYKARMVFGTDWPGLTYHPGSDLGIASVTLPRYIEELYVEMNDEKTNTAVKWTGGSNNLPSKYESEQLRYVTQAGDDLTFDDYNQSDWIFPNFLDPLINVLPIKDDFSVWESDTISDQTAAPITNSVKFFIGQKNLGQYDHISFALCELQLYGALITDSPTADPTMNPVAPSGSPTAAPSEAPTMNPSAAPSAAPTEDACPNFDIIQPCCAFSGGYEFLNYTYNKLNDQIVDEADVDTTCIVEITNADCCGNGTFISANPVTFQEV